MMELPVLPSIHEPGRLEALRKAFRLDPEALGRFRRSVYRLSAPIDEAAMAWPIPARQALAKSFEWSCLEQVSRFDSSLDGASKLLLRSQAGLYLETVILRIKSGRTSLCVSSQVGCAAKCAFCSTGNMGRAKNLTAAEILEQVVLANRELRIEGRRARNIVFMGMGEPMHNRAAVEEAIVRLKDPKWFGYSPNHLLVSTVGILDELLLFVRRLPDVNLALSLHSARQSVRERLVPLAKRYPLQETRDVLAEVQTLRQKPIMLEHLLLDGINDAELDAQALIEFCQGLDVHINLIPFNPVPGAAAFQPSPLPRAKGFAQALRAAGLVVTTRFSLGRDVSAACGQLAAMQEPK